VALVHFLEAMLQPGTVSIRLVDASVSAHSHEKQQSRGMAKRLPIILTSFSCEWGDFFKKPMLCSYSTKWVGPESNVEGHEWHHAIRSRMALLRAITTRQVHGSTLEHSPVKIARQF